MMPGGNEAAWPHIKDIFQSIAAKSDGEACCEWVGDEGAGHYVKMVHNGIEYGDMQLICEAYDIMKRGLGMSSKEIGDVFAKWNSGVLDSFLIEITRDIMYYNDDDGKPLVEKIRPGWPKGYRQVDCRQRPRSWHARHSDRRGCPGPLLVLHQGGAC